MKTISIRMLMAVVAIAALVMATAVMVKRSSEFRALADEQADSEQMSLAYADEGRGETGDSTACCARRADGGVSSGIEDQIRTGAAALSVAGRRARPTGARSGSIQGSKTACRREWLMNLLSFTFPSSKSLIFAKQQA